MTSLVNRAVAAPRALWGAVRRNGLANVAAFGLAFVRRQGLLETVRYAFLTADQRRQATGRGAQRPRPTGNTAETAPVANARDSDLDRSYGLPSAAWRQHLDKIRARRRPYGPTPPIQLALVLRADAGGRADAIARTFESLSKLDKTRLAGPLSVCILGGSGSAPPAPEGVIVVATPAELPSSPWTWILYLRAGDAVAPHFLDAAAPVLASRNQVVLTFDMAYAEDQRAYPLFLPGANPILAGQLAYSFSRLALRRSLTLEGADVDPDVALRAWLSARTAPDARDLWTHVPEPLVDAALTRQDVRDCIAALAPAATPTPDQPDVSIVICTKDKGRLLRQLVRALLADDRRLAKVVIVSNNTTDAYALRTLDDLAGHPKVQVVREDTPFNFSRLSNIGAALTNSDYLLFLNDDIVPVSDDWLGVLLAAFAFDPTVGVAGPLLVYPDERVQHAGMYLGYHGVAGHALRFARLPDEDYLYYASAPREVSALTGAAMLVSRACFDALGGFDELLATHLQDVDFSLRAKHAGFVNVFEPRSVLIHMESVSIRPIVGSFGMSRQRQRELDYFQQRWSVELKRDDLHGGGFDLDDETLRSLSP